MFAQEQSEALDMVNALREDVRRWRKSGYEGATRVTKELLTYWSRADRPVRLFFCQLEAAETVIYLHEIRLAKHPRFKSAVADEDLQALLDMPATEGLTPLTRLGLKMATGSGKTVVMAMLIAWAFCNRGKVASDERFPSAVLAVCPNLTIRERLQVLRPDNSANYFDEFDLVPAAMRPLLQAGRVMITNWHLFAPESEHVEGGKSYRVVQKGEESPGAFARRVLGDLYGRGPILVINDEAHHAWRPRPLEEAERLTAEEKEEVQEATVWIEGLDRLNQAVGIRLCLDLSATPFHIHGSGHIEGSPFPWLVSDFGLVDAIESGIVKIPRLPVSDTTGRPEPKYFRIWHNHILANLQPGDFLPGRQRKPKPERVYEEAEPALRTLAGQWKERFEYLEQASDEKDKTPPVLIIICDNTDIAEVFYRKISGEETVAQAADEDVEAEDDEGEEEPAGRKRKSSNKARIAYGTGSVFPEYLSNREGFSPTIRIDTKLLKEAETGDPFVSKQQAGERLRQIVATVGKKGQPGEQVRCVVSVAMLNEGWDAKNVTHIFGVRAFTTQLLCEQVVGRGLRRMDYSVDPKSGRFTEEYVDIYGVPFSLIPFKGRPVDKPEPGDKPKNHVRALPERAGMEIRFPVVEGYAFALKRNAIVADIGAMQPLRIEPEREPTAVFVKPRVGYQVGPSTTTGPGEYTRQDREAYYASTHLQTIEFEIARQVVAALAPDGVGAQSSTTDPGLRYTSRHQLFPQVLRLVDEYVRRKVDFRGENPCELGQEKYIRLVVERLAAAIRPDATQGEAPLLPILNRYRPYGTTADVDFKTTRVCHGTQRSHINLVPTDTANWERSAAFRLELSSEVDFYARNDQLGFSIPYDFMGASYHYEPDFLVRLKNGTTVVLEIKGMEDDQDRAKHEAARRWCDAVSNWGEMGRWIFHVNKDPQVVGVELGWLAEQVTSV
jgi:type III restriction enzyme